MMRCAWAVLGFSVFTSPVLSQTIFDTFTTAWDKSSLFKYSSPSPSIAFGAVGTTGAVDISVDDSTLYQTVYGFGATLTDSSAQLLSNLKSTNSDNYWALLKDIFDPTDGGTTAGLTYLRVPLGASDFSATVYSYDSTSGDTTLANFNINAAPSYVFSTITDIMSINSILKIHLVPWSAPGWMKGGTMDGGSLETSNINLYANYLLKCLQGFQGKSINAYAIGIQNEPENSDTTYPSTSMPVSTEAQVGTALRTLMDNNGFSSVKIIGYEHNWNDAANYPVQLMSSAGSAFSGVSFHCYEGDVTDQDTFHSQYPDKEIYETECTGTIGTDFWNDTKWFMDKLMIGAVNHNAMTAALWNLALDGSGTPILPNSDSCDNGACRGAVTINSDGSYTLNQEYYAMAHASRAIIPKDSGGPFGQRMGVTVSGDSSWALIVGAYKTGRANSSDQPRYSLVVLNWADSNNGVQDIQPIAATIEFRGAQASYTFPVGVTTLWWYAT